MGPLREKCWMLSRAAAERINFEAGTLGAASDLGVRIGTGSSSALNQYSVGRGTHWNWHPGSLLLLGPDSYVL